MSKSGTCWIPEFTLPGWSALRRGGVRALYGEKNRQEPSVSVIATQVASTILAGAVIRYDRTRGRNREMWLGGLLLVPQWAETIGRRKREVLDELATAYLSVRNK
jgi:hypothetical protein